MPVLPAARPPSPPAPVAPALAQLISPQLEAVEALFACELASDLANVNQLVTHVARFRGKMLRPTLVLLAGTAAGDSAEGLSDDHITLATVVEMVHMATLVHDDILDGAEVRRRGATINHLHGNEAAVLLGDYLISHAFHLCSRLRGEPRAGTLTASRLIGQTTNILCEGELTQNYHRHNWQLDEQTYFLIIYRKTAALTEACCRLGAMYATERPEVVDALAAYGRHLGLAFQIVDDVLDIVGQQKTVGKSLGTDIEKGKLTLPLIHFLAHGAPQHRDLLIALLESQDLDRVERVRQLIGPSDSIGYARQRAQGLVEEAIRALDILPPSEAREALIEAAQYVTARDK
ncbi:MAG TPA: polyprenyl synthetase family protein [Phycisphaerae bacterium]|nr:polyprenyl synthetase family protein [Phycisphaerae bacterium]